MPSDPMKTDRPPPMAVDHPSSRPRARRWIGSAILGRLVIVIAVAVFPSLGMRVWSMMRGPLTRHTLADRLSAFADPVHRRIDPDIRRAGCGHPPSSLVLIGLKDERRLEVWGQGPAQPPRFIRTYDILGASGELGPKLREGDRQVPEGVYAIESLNPNSAYHLSLRLNYPNAFDLEMARRDGRDRPGSDIMIHGSRSSIGCLAMGNEAAEDLFVLAAETGIEHVTVILSPVDFRVRDLPTDMPPVPPWTRELYARIREAMAPNSSSPH